MRVATYPPAGPASVGLEPLVARAFRSPFFRRRLERAGLTEGRAFGWDRWRAIPPTTKDELRLLDSFRTELVIAPDEEIVEYWRSGGVTGRPLFYPRTAEDIARSLDAFERSLRFAGVSNTDTFLISLPIGIHPAGQQMARGAERIGAATVWAGAGNQTPSNVQIELVHELGVTVWCGMASFALHLAHLAEGAGRPLATSRVKTLVTTAEMLSPSKRALLSRLWGARVVDTFGMSEITLMGAECGRRPGLHVWSEYSFCEVLDADSHEPVPDGEVGVLCVTPIAGGHAIPFVRWLSGDVVRLEYGCDCAAAAHPRMIHSGRTLSFFKVKGVNLNHAEVEDALYSVEALEDFCVAVLEGERLRVEVEAAKGTDGAVRAAVDDIFRVRFGLRAEVSVVERGTIARSVENQLKAQRFVDHR